MAEETEDKRLLSLLSAYTAALERTEKAVASDHDRDRAFRRLTVIGEHVQRIREQVTALRAQTAWRIYDDEQLSFGKLALRLNISRSRAAQLIRDGKPIDAEEDEYMPDEATQPERPPVVAGIITCEHGVLIGRRNDGKPPWTFIAGEIEPGESPADAIVREAKEEAGLRVVAADREIGRRVHPKTGRTMIYLACSPTGKTDVFVGDPDELAEVRWVPLSEAEELLPGLFEPVHRYLTDQLGDSS